MKLIFIFLSLITLFSLNSCIEIFDDLTIHNDGTGTFKYNINLSSSKLKINSILALDSLNGVKVPSIEVVKSEIARIKSKFELKMGISNVTIESNFTDFIFKIKCDFTNVGNLQTAIKEIVSEENLLKNIDDLSHNWVSWEGQKLTRNIPDISFKTTKELTANEIELLTQGKYTSITRFDRPIEKFDNQTGKLSASKMAIMLQTNTYSLIQNAKLLENTIYLSPLKN
jgi:hypothetical protein